MLKKFLTPNTILIALMRVIIAITSAQEDNHVLEIPCWWHWAELVGAGATRGREAYEGIVLQEVSNNSSKNKGSGSGNCCGRFGRQDSALLIFKILAPCLDIVDTQSFFK